MHVVVRREVGAGLDDERALGGEERGGLRGVAVLLVVLHDHVVQAVVHDVLERIVELVAQSGVVLGEYEPVLLDGGVVQDVQDLEVGVGGALGERDGAVHDLRIGLACV